MEHARKNKNRIVIAGDSVELMQQGRDREFPYGVWDCIHWMGGGGGGGEGHIFARITIPYPNWHYSLPALQWRALSALNGAGHYCIFFPKRKKKGKKLRNISIEVGDTGQNLIFSEKK